MKLKHIFALSLAVLTAAILLSSCGGVKADTLTESNVVSKMAELMPEAEKYTSYLIRGRISPVEYDYDTAYKDANGCTYVPVSDDSLNTIEKLKTATEKYFTAEYAAENLYTCFEGDYPIYKEIDGVLNINIDCGGGGGYTYATDTAKILSDEGGTVKVGLDALDSYNGKYVCTVTLSLIDGIYKIAAIDYAEA